MEEAVAKTYQRYFLPELNSVPRIATITEKGQDILIAKWPAAADSPYSELIVWDTPQNTYFIFKLPTHSWSSDAAIRESFERLVVPPANGVVLDIARDAQTEEWIGAGGLRLVYAPRQFDVGPLNWVDLWETGRSSYLCVAVSMFATNYHPGNMRTIPQRFPPLESRIKEWTKQRILEELSAEPQREDVGSVNSLAQWKRAEGVDAILSKELMQRDVVDAELLALLLKRRPHENGALLQAVVDAGQAARFSSAISYYLRTSRGEGYTKALERPAFEIVNRTRDANFTGAALDVLRRESPADGAFMYAAEHGETPLDYRALTDLPRLPDPLMSMRDYALLEMRKRLSLDDSGNLIGAK